MTAKKKTAKPHPDDKPKIAGQTQNTSSAPVKQLETVKEPPQTASKTPEIVTNASPENGGLTHNLTPVSTRAAVTIIPGGDMEVMVRIPEAYVGSIQARAEELHLPVQEYVQDWFRTYVENDFMP